MVKNVKRVSTSITEQEYLQIKFYNNIQKLDNGCWKWLGALGKGYGSIWYRGKLWITSRFAYHTFKNPVLPGLVVCHTCDNRLCVNPDHLFMGTQVDNMQDAVAKGRAIKGERVGVSKLTAEQVLSMRSDHPNLGYRKLGKKYGVSRTTALGIIKRKYWKHI